MRDLRIIALLLIGTSVALTALDQGNDVMRDHVDGANVAFASWSPQPAFFRWIALFVSCVFAGVNAWYWSHLLYKSHGPEERSQPGWYVSLRRLMGVMPLLAAASAMLVSVDWALSEVWLGVAIFVGGALLLHRFFAARLSLAARMPAPLQRIAEPARFGQGRLAIGDVAFATASLLTAVALFTLFLIPSTRVAFAWRLGPAAVTFLAVGCIIPVTSLLIWSTRAQRVPVVGLGLLAFAGCSLVNDNHAVRPLDPGTPVRDRVALEAAYAAWAKTLKPTDPVVLVAAAGGASRAAYWAASVLRALDEASGERFSRHVFAISGVSGGALGAVAYAGWTSGASAPAGAVERRSGFLQQFLGDDFLSPAVAGMLFPDLLQRFLPAPLLPSRAVYLEEAWERGWRKAMGDCRAAHASACGVDDLMAADFLAMWSGLLDQRPDAPWTPLVFSNGTHVQTGKRIITAPVRITPDAFEDAIDFFDMFGHPVRASTAVHNSARFPIVSPAGRITGHLGTKGHVVDGGYFENGGLETVYDIARAIRRIECMAAPCPEANQRRIIIIEISNDDLRDKNSISRRQAPGDTLAAPVVQSYWGSPPLGEATSIVGGLYATRTARGELTAKRLSDVVRSGLGKASYFSFPLEPVCIDQPPNAADACSSVRRVSMSWLISMVSKFGMDVRLNTPLERIDELVEKLAPQKGDDGAPSSGLPRDVAARIKTFLRKVVASSHVSKERLAGVVAALGPPGGAEAGDRPTPASGPGAEQRTIEPSSAGQSSAAPSEPFQPVQTPASAPVARTFNRTLAPLR